MRGCLRLITVTTAFGAASFAQAKPILEPKIQITAAYAQRFPTPFGYGLHMEYSITDVPSYARLESVATEYSGDGGTTWLTDEPARSPSYTWDNVHGNVVCGPNRLNLESGHLYALRVILHWAYENDDAPRATTSNVAFARVASYLCNETDGDQDGIPDDLELALAKRYFPDAWAVDLAADLKTFYGYSRDPFVMRHGTIPFVVRPLPSANGRCQESLQCLEIKYGMAFSWDCGSGAPQGGCSGTLRHVGDSESYSVLVARRATSDPTAWGVDWESAKSDPAAWYLVADRTTAHQDTPTDFTAYGWYGRWAEAPKVYLAHGKHGGYHTTRACSENGIPGFKDECAENLRVRDYVDLSPWETRRTTPPSTRRLEGRPKSFSGKSTTKIRTTFGRVKTSPIRAPTRGGWGPTCSGRPWQRASSTESG